MKFKVGDRVITIQNSILHEGIIKNIRNNDSICEVSLDGYNILLVTSIDNISRITKEKTTLENLEQRIEKLEKEVFKPIVIHDRPKEKSLLTEDERVILRNFNKMWKWIARDRYGGLYAYNEKPEKKDNGWENMIGNFCAIDFLLIDLFQFIKWEDDEPYNIEELLKGECGNE